MLRSGEVWGPRAEGVPQLRVLQLQECWRRRWLVQLIAAASVCLGFHTGRMREIFAHAFLRSVLESDKGQDSQTSCEDSGLRLIVLLCSAIARQTDMKVCGAVIT